MFRHYSFIDKIIVEAESFIGVVKPNKNTNCESYPAKEIKEPILTPQERKHTASLMRVNHTGEVCAQALYRGQAFVAKNESTRKFMLHAALEEHNHLNWCNNRLNELDDKTSIFNFVWYAGSFTIGAAAGYFSDSFSYGFIVETEKQVMHHLNSHLTYIPSQDEKTRAILQQMHADELKHASEAKNAGGIELPFPVRLIMKIQSKIMTTVTYKF